MMDDFYQRKSAEPALDLYIQPKILIRKHPKKKTYTRLGDETKNNRNFLSCDEEKGREKKNVEKNPIDL